MSPRMKSYLLMLATAVLMAALQAALNFLTGNPLNAGSAGLAGAAGYGLGRLAALRVV
ncbi:MAG: hypothetical protein NAOJABEB_03331 [Steroidobacteraceae bacterium]|nr:hypothetical protein [Steroidobacteraceae bacterium]